MPGGRPSSASNREASLTLEVSEEELALLRHLDFPCTQELLDAARPVRGRYRLSGSRRDFDDLSGWVAGEANHEDRKGRSLRGDLLGAIFERLECVLVTGRG